jgi:hypothetical protein
MELSTVGGAERGGTYILVLEQPKYCMTSKYWSTVQYSAVL